MRSGVRVISTQDSDDQPGFSGAQSDSPHVHGADLEETVRDEVVDSLNTHWFDTLVSSNQYNVRKMVTTTFVDAALIMSSNLIKLFCILITY